MILLAKLHQKITCALILGLILFNPFLLPSYPTQTCIHLSHLFSRLTRLLCFRSLVAVMRFRALSVLLLRLCLLVLRQTLALALACL